MALFLGIDGGGSKCDAVLLDEKGTVLGWGSGGAVTYTPPEEVSAAFSQAIGMACSDRDLTGLRVCTIAARHGTFDWLHEHGVEFTHSHVSEWDAGFRIGMIEAGLMILAGTGSFVHGRVADGRRLQVGGLGPILGDEGSGYDIGLRALRAILRVRHASNHSEFRAALLEAAGVANQWDLVGRVYGGKMGRPQIAALCPVVVAQAVAGEPMALDVLRAAAAELAESVDIVLNELDIRGAGLTALGVGGVIQGSPLYWGILSGLIRESDPSLHLTVPPVKLVLGAAFHALEEAGIPVTAELRDRVVETQKAFPGARVVSAE